MPSGYVNYEKKSMPKFVECWHGNIFSQEILQIYNKGEITIGWYNTCARRFLEAVPSFLLDKLSDEELKQYRLDKCVKCNIECSPKWSRTIQLMYDAEGKPLARAPFNVILEHITRKNLDSRDPYPVKIYVGCSKPKQPQETGNIKQLIKKLSVEKSKVPIQENYDEIPF